MHGLYVDLIAPCAADGHFLQREYHVHLRRMARIRDVQGVVVNGPAGEASVLDYTMRMDILKAARSAAPAGFPLLAAVPADTNSIADEASAALELGATGIVVLGSGTEQEDSKALQLALDAAPDATLVAWNMPYAVAASLSGVTAVVSGTAGQTAGNGELAVMSTDQNFDLRAISSGQAAGAVLASANISEALWGRVFRYANDEPGRAEEIYSDRLQGLQQALLALDGPDSDDYRQVVAAIKHCLFTMTQNSSAATFPPLVEIGDTARETLSNALLGGRLLPGMA